MELFADYARGCFVSGQCGLCGPKCWVYQDGECFEPVAVRETLSESEQAEHDVIYTRIMVAGDLGLPEEGQK